MSWCAPALSVRRECRSSRRKWRLEQEENSRKSGVNRGSEENQVDLLRWKTAKQNCYGQRIHFEGLWNKERKGLQLDINDGMSLKVQAPLVGMQTIEIKGSGLLTRDEQKRPVLVVTTRIPGIDNPVTVSVPLRHFIGGVQSQIKKKFTKAD